MIVLSFWCVFFYSYNNSKTAVLFRNGTKKIKIKAHPQSNLKLMKMKEYKQTKLNSKI